MCSFVMFQDRCFKWSSKVFLTISGELLLENDSLPVSLSLMIFPMLRVMFLALSSLVDISVVICKIWSCDKSTCVVLFLGNLLHFSSLGVLPASYLMNVYCLMTRCNAKKLSFFWNELRGCFRSVVTTVLLCYGCILILCCGIFIANTFLRDVFCS